MRARCSARARFASILLAALGAVAASSCRAALGIDDRVTARSQCSSCAADACGAETAACRASADCAARLDCVARCELGDVGCETRCAAPGVAEPAAMGALSACRSAHCGEACELACGDVTLAVAASSQPACATCAASACCGPMGACAASGDCLAALECTREYPTPDWQAACSEQRFPAGADGLAALQSCVRANCPDDCAYGADWDCVGHAAWPVLQGTQVTLTLFVTDYFTETNGVAGIVAKACRSNDPDCAEPLQTATTDATGHASLTLSNTGQFRASAFDGYLDLRDPKGTYYPERVFASPPVTQTGWTMVAAMAPESVVTQGATQLGIAIDPARGHLALLAQDCVGKRAPNVSFHVDTADAETRIVYANGLIPAPNATATDIGGLATAANVPAGLATVTATVDGVGVIGRTTILVVPNVEHFVVVVPSPAQ